MIELKKNPARYSKELLPVLAKALEGYETILDPMAGTGERLFSIRSDAYLHELEPEWGQTLFETQQSPLCYTGDILNLMFKDEWFDAVVTSPTYGNRMADHHKAKDISKRNTYTHMLGRELHPNNSGKLQWGKEYRKFHYLAWQQVWRVLKPGGRFVLNVSDHIRKGKIIRVTHFHKILCIVMGFNLVEQHYVVTPRQRQGENGEKRVSYEMVFVFDKPRKIMSE